ncbi:hypothetical protein BU24DRAFT_437518 [Aaosphaeria arxii CBS 175.79]|uniref:VWFA domain-containing protein n=1 Tax=Aaosphaeria arxii CBS 175.79 TaxID=1450172 RepID=A0A6A5X7V8_9PLEO|nr:uncharacterized protein BU24DRAFT_437518 [Aaosphaeria arxii CBS 175.79]KAF2009001.1 hypothetical protein BU24DRAFT_437518 [Aaosphaeria arxii CBS 175.79]
MFNSLKKKLSRKGSNPFTKGDDATTSRAVTSTSGHLAAPRNANNPFTSANSAAAAPNNDAPPAYTATPRASPQTQVTNIPVGAGSSTDDPFAFLKSFDTIFLIDDSGSMAGRSWRETQRALETITPICTQRDADGIDIYFLNHPDSDYYKNVTSPGSVVEIFQSVRPGGGTPTGQKLNNILRPYIRQCERSLETTKPINIIVITDGEPSDDVESPIINAAKKLDKLDAPAWQVGIQFFQVGREPGAREALKQLDDGLEEIAGGDLRDIVDTVPFMGDDNAELSAAGIMKVVLGSVNRRLDRNSKELHRRS